MDILKLESNTKKYFILSCAFFLVGVILMYAFRDFDSKQFSDNTTSFFLGALLFILSFSLLLAPYKEVTIVDSARGRILIEGRTIFGKRESVISADDIESARVAFIGKASNFIGNTYYISLHMKDGSHFPLFLSGYYDGRNSKNALSERLTILSKMLDIKCMEQ